MFDKTKSAKKPGRDTRHLEAPSDPEAFFEWVEDQLLQVLAEAGEEAEEQYDSVAEYNEALLPSLVTTAKVIAKASYTNARRSKRTR